MRTTAPPEVESGETEYILRNAEMKELLLVARDSSERIPFEVVREELKI